MDRVKAKQWEVDLKGRPIGGWTVRNLINHGKSAAVFRATKGNRRVALKVFDDELIERYGDKTQLARIDRELTLVGKNHKNLVKIIDGGFDNSTKNHFIVMQYLDGPNLKDCLKKIPTENIPKLISQLASCGKYLESLGLVHRDIKPENIVLLKKYSQLMLLDFGVLRPVGEPGLTDGDGVQAFVGTLQYSSPEFLLRQEQDTVEGWRALSLYQIGGVLHDLIMRKPLFSEFINPYARLVNAVQHDVPQIQSSEVPPYLVEAARGALVKDPNIRNQLVSWASFEEQSASAPGVASAKQRVTNRAMMIQADSEPKKNEADEEQLLLQTVELIKSQARAVRNENAAGLPPVVVTREPPDGPKVRVRFRPSQSHGLPEGFSMLFEVRVLDPRAAAIRLDVAAARGWPEALATEQRQIFAGIFAPTSIYSAIESAIYFVADKVQQPTESEGSGQIDLTDLGSDA